MIIGSVFQGDTIIINVYKPNNKGWKHMSQKLRATWRNRWIYYYGDFSIHLLEMHRSL